MNLLKPLAVMTTTRREDFEMMTKQQCSDTLAKFSEMKHTMGPWEAAQTMCGELAIFTEGGTHTLSSDGDAPLPRSEREANAAIQAASVDMFESLTLIVQGFTERAFIVSPNYTEPPELLIGLNCFLTALGKGKQALLKAQRVDRVPLDLEIEDEADLS